MMDCRDLYQKRRYRATPICERKESVTGVLQGSQGLAYKRRQDEDAGDDADGDAGDEALGVGDAAGGGEGLSPLVGVVGHQDLVLAVVFKVW